MSDTHAIREVARRLKTAASFAAVFGALPKGDARAQRGYIRKQFGFLASLVHPDHVSPEDSKEASEAFRLLNELRHAAEDAIGRGAYEKPITPKDPGNATSDYSEIVSSKGTYRLSQKVFAEGDFSMLYRGTMLGSTSVPIIAKIAREPADNSWLEKEAVLLKQAADAKAKTPLSGISPFLPNILDTLFVEGDGGRRYRANIVRFVPGMVSIADIMRAYPGGLEAPQAAWVARRIFAQTLAASMLGVTHGAITPDHVLVHPVSHEPLHTGWGHATSSGRVTHIIDRWRDIYPPEVFKKEDADHRTDIYMAAATIVRLLGGDVARKKLPASVPPEVARLILRCLEESPSRRPQDGRALLDEFTRVVRSVWGRTYRQLDMPVR